MSNIKISVIIPVYKVPLEYLRACFDSLVAQTLQECEFIVVSDGSPEAESSICEAYTAKDSRFKFFKREHEGVSATRNYGIEQAQGEYISFVDSDDWLVSNALNVLLALIQKSSSDIGLANAVKEDCLKISKPLLGLRDACVDLNLGHIPHFAAWGYIFKTSIIKDNDIKFRNDLRYSEDRVFIFQYCACCKVLAMTNVVVYFYRQHAQSVCHENPSLEIVKQQFLAARYIKEILIKEKAICASAINKIIYQIVRMGIVLYVKNGVSKQDYFDIKELFVSTINSSFIIFYYCWYRARISAFVGKLLHL